MSHSNFTKKRRFLTLHSTTGTLRVAYKTVKCFDSYSCSPPKLSTDFRKVKETMCFFPLETCMLKPFTLLFIVFAFSNQQKIAERIEICCNVLILM